MAKFFSAYGLSAIGDQRGMLGVSFDEEGCAVVTIGKNMVVRYQLSNQKQLNSWSTTLAKLSAKVVYNPTEEKYIGVFDGTFVKKWHRAEASLEKVKKHRLSEEVYEILLHKAQSSLGYKAVVVFNNGSSNDLELALKNRKESLPGFLQPKETIQAADIITIEEKEYLILVTKFENKYQLCCCPILEDGSYQVDCSAIKKLKLRRPNAALLGYCTLQGSSGSSFLTFWSDCFLYSLELPMQSEQGIGKFIGTINTASRKSEVSMRGISESHFAIYAGDMSEEGAVLGIYNVNFGMMQSQTHFKMFNKPPRMWLIDNILMVLMGQRLVCVPFNLQSESLSALVGSKPLVADLVAPSDISTVLPIVVWEKESEKNDMDVEPNFPKNIREQLSTLSSEGWSESGICKALIGQLIEKKDMDSMIWILENFIDIPEELLVKLISLSFSDSEKKDDVLNKILSIPINSTHLLKNLRLHLKVEEALLLLNYLSELMINVSDPSNIFEWTITLVDAFYQQFILTKNKEVLDAISLLRERVHEQINLLRDMSVIVPLVMRVKSGKEIKPNFSRNYVVERISLYK